MIALALLLIVQASVREQVQAEDEARAAAIDTVMTGGVGDVPASDDYVRAAAKHFCGTAEPCTSEHFRARDELVREYAGNKHRKKSYRC